MLLLAFDTATPAVTVALHDGLRVLASQTTVSSRRHAELLAAMIERVLAEAAAAPTDLEAIAVGPVFYPELGGHPIPARYPDAAQLADIAARSLADRAPCGPVEPLYLRRPDAQVPGKPKRVRP